MAYSRLGKLEQSGGTLPSNHLRIEMKVDVYRLLSLGRRKNICLGSHRFVFVSEGKHDIYFPNQM